MAENQSPRRRILVTGGASGIGRAICERIAATGGMPLIVDIDAEGGETVASATGGKFVRCDLGDLPASTDTLRSAVESHTDVLDGVVCAAGVSSAAHYPAIDFADWERVIRINMTAPLFVVQSLDRLLARPGASIVMITSIEATHVISTSERSTPAYAAAKAGLKLITESLASDLAEEGVRVNAVAPGFVRTALTDGMRERGAGGWVEKVVPMGRWAEADEIAQAAMYLLDDASRFVSGISLVVDGGLTLGITPAMTEDEPPRK